LLGIYIAYFLYCLFVPRASAILFFVYILEISVYFFLRTLANILPFIEGTLHLKLEISIQAVLSSVNRKCWCKRIHVRFLLVAECFESYMILVFSIFEDIRQLLQHVIYLNLPNISKLLWHLHSILCGVIFILCKIYKRIFINYLNLVININLIRLFNVCKSLKHWIDLVF